MFKGLVSFLINHRKSVMIAMAVITLFFLSQIFRIQMFTQFLDLFPYNHPYVQVHKQYAKYFGGAYQATLMLEVKKGDVFNMETLDEDVAASRMPLTSSPASTTSASCPSPVPKVIVLQRRRTVGFSTNAAHEGCADRPEKASKN